MIITKTHYRKTQNEPNITRTVHLKDVNEIPPDISEPLDSFSETSMASSVSIHNGNSIKIFKQNTNKNKLYNILNSQLNSVYRYLELSCLHLVSLVRYETLHICMHKSCFCCMWHNPFPWHCSFSDLVLRASIFCHRFGSPKP